MTRLRETHRIPLRLPDGATVYLSPGEHNALQVAIIEEFGPRFAPGADVLYVGDTAKKHVIFEQRPARRAGRADHRARQAAGCRALRSAEAMAVYDRGGYVARAGFAEDGIGRSSRSLGSCPAERVYVTAFLSIGDFRKYAADIAWETEVWIAATPDHMIHFNGPKFLGPYKAKNG